MTSIANHGLQASDLNILKKACGAVALHDKAHRSQFTNVDQLANAIQVAQVLLDFNYMKKF